MPSVNIDTGGRDRQDSSAARGERLYEQRAALEALLASPENQRKASKLAAESLSVEVRCNSCGRRQRHRVDHVMFAPPDPEQEPHDDWDGVVPSAILRCKGCGAEDDYEVTPLCRLALLTRVIGEQEPQPGTPGTVSMAAAGLWDGTIMRRPTQGLAHLRRLAESEPSSGEAWRRLGNLCERFDRTDEALEAWRKAVEVDEDETEAAYSLLAHYFTEGPLDETLRWGQTTLERLGRNKLEPAMRRAAVACVVEVLAGVAARVSPPLALMAGWQDGRPVAGSVTVRVSSVDLRKIESWDRLTELLASDRLLTAALTDDLPDEDPTQLQALLSDGPRAMQLALEPETYVHSRPKVGRNAPCPCGSGRKYKKCCLDR